MPSTDPQHNRSQTNSQVYYSKSKNRKRDISNHKNGLSSNKSSHDDVQIQKQIKKILTSTTYNAIYSKLINLQNLRDFIKQSSKYVQFIEQQVKTYLASQKLQKMRFSFSFKSTATCSFLIRDYRFIIHYYRLLVKQFPQKKYQLRQTIYKNYRQNIIDSKKFEDYFGDSKDRIVENLFRSKSKKKSSKNQSQKKLHQNQFSSSLRMRKKIINDQRICIQQNVSKKLNPNNLNSIQKISTDIKDKSRGKQTVKIGKSKTQNKHQKYRNSKQTKQLNRQEHYNYKKYQKLENQSLEKKKQTKQTKINNLNYSNKKQAIQIQKQKQNYNLNSNLYQAKLNQQKKIVKPSNNQINKLAKQPHKRRKTMENILIIQNTINQIEMMCMGKTRNTIKQHSKQHQNKTLDKIINNQLFQQQTKQIIINQFQVCVSSEESIDKNSLNNKDLQYFKRHGLKKNKNQNLINAKQYLCIQDNQSIQNNQIILNNQIAQNNYVLNQDQFLQNLLNSKKAKYRSKSNKLETQKQKIKKQQTQRKEKQNRRKTNKIIDFKQFINQSNPKDKILLQKINRLSRKLQTQQLQKNKQTNQFNLNIQLVKKNMYTYETSIRRPFNNEQKKLIPKQLIQILELFPQIKTIGQYNQYVIEKPDFCYCNLGVVRGYQLQQILAWPKNIDQNPCKGLTIIKVQDCKQQEVQNKKLQQWRQKIQKQKIEGINVVLIKN